MNESYSLYIGQSYPHKSGTIAKKDIVKTVSKHFEGCTIQSGVGYWKNEQEKTVIVHATTSHENMRECVNDIKRTFEQESVMVQKHNTNTVFL